MTSAASRLVSRAHEIGLLEAATTQLAGGTGGSVCIIGEAGIGKTSIIGRWLDGDLREPVTLRTVCGIAPDRHRRLGILRRLLPDLPEPAGDVGAEIAEGILAHAELIARRGPAVMVLDDLHHADPLTLDALLPLCRRAADLGILIVVAARPEGTTGPLSGLIDTVGEFGTCLWPTPLDAHGIDTLVADRLGHRCGQQLQAALATAAGNPFLVEDYLRCLDNDGVLRIEGATVDLATGLEAPLPGDLGRRLAARVMAGLPGGYDVLRTIAVLPGGATPEEVARLLELPIATVTATCLRATEAGTLLGSGDQLCFRHDLLRRAVLDQIPPAIAHSIARRAGDVLADTGGDPARVASCWLAGFDSRQPGHLERMLELGTAYAPHHPVAAAALLEPVAEHLSAARAQRVEIARLLGWSLLGAGRAGEVTAMLRRLGLGEGDDGFDRLRDLADSLSGGLHQVVERLAAVDAESLGTGSTPPDAGAVDRAAHAALLLVAGRRFAEARGLADWVSSSTTPAGPARRALVAIVNGWLAAFTGEFEIGVEESRTALQWVDDERLRWLGRAIPTVIEAMCLGHLGRLDEALDRVRTTQAQLRLPAWGPPLLHAFGTGLHYQRGRWGDALADFGASLDGSAGGVHVTSFYSPYAFAALIAAARDGREAARAALPGCDAALPVIDDRMWATLAHVMALPLDGSQDGEALARIGTCVAANAEQGTPAHLLCGGPELAWFGARRGRADVATSVVDQLARVASRTGSPYVRAVRDWAASIVAGSSEEIGTVATRLAASGYVTDAARAAHHAAVLAATTGDAELASTTAQQAFGLYTELDADQWSRELRAELRAGGVDIRAPGRRSGSIAGWDALTRSERRVVDLLVEGLTNAEIATRLVVSRRTVESHLRRVYTKVDLHSRPQLLRSALDQRRTVAARH